MATKYSCESRVIKPAFFFCARFRKNPARLLRGIRLGIRLGIPGSPELTAALRSFAPELRNASPRALARELTRTLTGFRPDRALELWREFGILDAVLPEIARFTGETQPPCFHPEGDVFDHTRDMLRAMCAPSPELAWSALLHDVGKPASRTVDSDGRPRFFKHEELGAPIADEILKRLEFPEEFRETVVHAVRNHMAFGTIRRSGRVRDAMESPQFALEMELNRLDARSMRRYSENFTMYLDRSIAAAAEALRPPPLLTGRDLIAAGIRPGPRFGAVLAEIRTRQLDGELRTPEQALATARTLLDR